MKKIPCCILVIFAFMLSAKAVAQQPVTQRAMATKINYKHAERLVWDSLYNKVYHLSVTPNWFTNAKGFAYRAHTEQGNQFYAVTFANGRRKKAFSLKELSKKVGQLTGHKIAAENFSPDNFEWKDKNRVTFSYHRKKYELNTKNGHLKRLPKKHKNDRSKNTSVSPNGKGEVFLKNYNLYYKNLENDKTYPLSADGKKFYIYGSTYGWNETMVGENAGPEPRLSVSWSPNSQKIVTQITDARHGEKMYLLNWSIDSLYRPQLMSYYRASPGDTQDLKYIPLIYNVQTQRKIKIDLPKLPHYLAVNLHWMKDGKHLYGVYNHRGYKTMDVIEVDAQTGAVRTVYTENSKTNIDYKTLFRFVEEANVAFITSEKTGWKQLYLLHWDTGKLQPVTHGKYVVKAIKAIDVKNHVVYFTAAGRKKGINPYFESLYKVNFDGTGLTLLTPEPVNHEVSISPNMRYFVDNSSTATKPTVSYLRSTKNGAVIAKIDEAVIDDVLKIGWRFPTVFTVTARDGKTTLYGALWKPANFDPHKKYPIVDYTYTGPHMHVFPNTFKDGLYGLYNSAQALADLGFIVMEVDGMGSAGRSKAFHEVSYGHLGHNLKDHVLAIQQLGKRYSWIDTTRVGIYGHSFGGYDAAHALEVYHNCYKVAVSESGDHDWRMEKAWYPEMYAGWPVGAVYQNQSNVTLAPQMKGKLLLIHGGIDENVNPSATFKLAQALIDAGKYFDMLILPSERHHFKQKYVPYVRKKRWKFFVQHLIINPPNK